MHDDDHDSDDDDDFHDSDDDDDDHDSSDDFNLHDIDDDDDDDDGPVVGVGGEDDVASEDDHQLRQGEIHQQPVDWSPELTDYLDYARCSKWHQFVYLYLYQFAQRV